MASAFTGPTPLRGCAYQKARPGRVASWTTLNDRCVRGMDGSEVGAVRVGSPIVGRGTRGSRRLPTGYDPVRSGYAVRHEKRHIDAEMQTRQDNLAAELNKRQTEIKQLQSDLELLPAGGDDFTRTQEELERKAINLQAWGAYEQKKLQREVAIRNDRMLKKVIDAVGRVAQDNGYDAVLNPENRIQVPTGNAAQPTRTANLPIVLWNSGQHDITDQVIQLMNNEFANMVSAP